MTEARNTIDRALAALGVMLVIATGVVLAVVGGQSAAPATGGQSAAKSADHVVIRNFAFAAADITVKAGTKIRFTNLDSTAHTATSGTSPNPDGVFDTGTLNQGQTRTVTVSKPGTYTYYCGFHPFMKGTVTVK